MLSTLTSFPEISIDLKIPLLMLETVYPSKLISKFVPVSFFYAFLIAFFTVYSAMPFVMEK